MSSGLIVKMFVCAVVTMGAVMADQAEDLEQEHTSLLQVSQKPTIAPIAKDEAGGFSAPPGRKSGYARAIGEMMLIVFAVVFWSQLKESFWTQPPAKAQAKKAVAPDDAWRGVLLHEAVRSNDVEGLQKNAVAGDVDYRDNLDRTPLHVASALGFAQAAEALLALGANASARDFDDATPTMMAGQRGHREVVRLLLDAGAVVGGRDEDLPPVVAQELMRRLLK